MRLLFLILVLVNALAYGYIRFAEGRAGSDNQLPLLQIAPEKMKLLKPGTPPPPRNDASRARPSLVCLEWGGFGSDETTRVASALTKLGIIDKVTQRETAQAYWVYIPPLKTQAEVDKKAAELKSRGVAGFITLQDYAIALGEFKSDEAANDHLAQLRLKGVRSAVAGPRGNKTTLFVIRDPGDALAARVAELKAEFPATQLSVTTCADALTAKN